MIKKERYLLKSCLVDARKMLLFMVEQVFLLMREIWSVHDVDMQCIVLGELVSASRLVLSDSSRPHGL